MKCICYNCNKTTSIYEVKSTKSSLQVLTILRTTYHYAIIIFIIFYIVSTIMNANYNHVYLFFRINRVQLWMAIIKARYSTVIWNKHIIMQHNTIQYNYSQFILSVSLSIVTKNIDKIIETKPWHVLHQCSNKVLCHP